MYPCGTPYSRIFRAREQSYRPGSDIPSTPIHGGSSIQPRRQRSNNSVASSDDSGVVPTFVERWSWTPHHESVSDTANQASLAAHQPPALRIELHWWPVVNGPLTEIVELSSTACWATSRRPLVFLVFFGNVNWYVKCKPLTIRPFEGHWNKNRKRRWGSSPPLLTRRKKKVVIW